MEMKIVGITVAILVSITVLAGVLMPILTDYGSDTFTYTNTGTPYAAFDGETHTIVVSYDGSTTTITTDGESCQLPDFSLYGNATIIYGSDAIIRLNNAGAIRGFSDAFYGINATSGKDVTLELSSTAVTMTDGTDTRVVPITPLAYIASEGEYRLSLNPCVTDDTVIIGGTSELTGGKYISTVAVGPVDDLSITNPFCNLGTGVTITSIEATVNATDVSGSLKKIDNITFNVVLSDDTEQNAVFSYFLAPEKVTYDNPNYLGDNVSSLLLVIPMLVIVAILIGVVALVIRSRLD